MRIHSGIKRVRSAHSGNTSGVHTVVILVGAHIGSTSAYTQWY